MRLEGLAKFKNLIGNRTRDFPACSVMSQTNYATACPLPMEGISVQTAAGQDNSSWGPLVVTKFKRVSVDVTLNDYELTFIKLVYLQTAYL
jgi:hypothetical protein